MHLSINKEHKNKLAHQKQLKIRVFASLVCLFHISLVQSKAYMCIEISMSAPNRYLVQLHGRPRAVTNVSIGDKFVYVGPVDAHVLYSSDAEPCPPGIILTVTDRVETRPAVGSGASKLVYQLCSSELSPRSAARYDMSSFERWMYAETLARMINRRQLRKVPEVSHQEAFGRRKV